MVRHVEALGLKSMALQQTARNQFILHALGQWGDKNGRLARWMLSPAPGRKAGGTRRPWCRTLKRLLQALGLRSTTVEMLLQTLWLRSDSRRWCC